MREDILPLPYTASYYD